MTVRMASGACTYVPADVVQRMTEIDVQHARRWTVGVLDNVPDLYANQLRGVIANRQRYHFLKEMDEGDFLHGVWLGLCDYFNGGCEIEDLSVEICEILGMDATNAIEKRTPKQLEDIERYRVWQERRAQETARVHR